MRLCHLPAQSPLSAADDGVRPGVYDLTDFLPIHPGGSILASQGGKDATDFFDELHRPEVLQEVAEQFRIGVVSGSAAQVGNAHSDPRLRRTHGSLHRL